MSNYLFVRLMHAVMHVGTQQLRKEAIRISMSLYHPENVTLIFGDDVKKIVSLLCYDILLLCNGIYIFCVRLTLLNLSVSLHNGICWRPAIGL